MVSTDVSLYQILSLWFFFHLQPNVLLSCWRFYSSCYFQTSVSPHYFKQFTIGSSFELRFSRKLAQTSDAFQDLKPVELFYFCICKLVLIHASVCVLINKMMYTVFFFLFGYFLLNFNFMLLVKNAFIQKNSADISLSLQRHTMIEKACFRLLTCVLGS